MPRVTSVLGSTTFWHQSLLLPQGELRPRRLLLSSHLYPRPFISPWHALALALLCIGIKLFSSQQVNLRPKCLVRKSILENNHDWLQPTWQSPADGRQAILQRKSTSSPRIPQKINMDGTNTLHIIPEVLQTPLPGCGGMCSLHCPCGGCLRPESGRRWAARGGTAIEAWLLGVVRCRHRQMWLVNPNDVMSMGCSYRLCRIVIFNLVRLNSGFLKTIHF